MKWLTLRLRQVCSGKNKHGVTQKMTDSIELKYYDDPDQIISYRSSDSLAQGLEI